MKNRMFAFVLALAAMAALPGRAWAFDLPARLASMGVLEAVLIGLAAYFAVRLIGNLMRRGKTDANTPPTYDVSPKNADAPPDEEGDGMDRRRARAQAMWKQYGGEEGDGGGFGRSLDDAARSAEARPLPGGETPSPGAAASSPGFDEADFLRGAKAMYVRVRKSWAARDLVDLAQFCTPAMQARFAAWAGGNPDKETFDALLVQAHLAELRQENGRSLVDVRYEATVADNPKARESRSVNEIWRFVKDDDPKATWKLDDWQTVQ